MQGLRMVGGLAEFNATIFILLCVLCILVFFYFCF